MVSDRSKTKLGELFRVKHGFAFKGEYFASEGPHVLLTPGNFAKSGGLKLKGDKEKFYTGPVSTEFVLNAGDLLIAMTDLTQQAPILGSAAIIPESGKYLHNQRLGKVISMSDDVLPAFLYYLLNDETVRAQVRSSASGATVKHTSPDRIYEVAVLLPNREEQSTIVGALKPFDELVANSLRRIEILEEMAQVIYQEWFVRFRFPRGVDQNGPSPDHDLEGWQETTLGAVTTITMGQSPKSESVNDEGVGLPFHQGVGTYGARFPSTERFTTVTNRTAEKDDVLFSVRAPVGRINVANERLVVGRGLASIRSNHGRPWFLLEQLKAQFQEEDQMGGGTIFNAVTKDDVHGIPFMAPPEALQDKFEAVVTPIAALLENLYQQKRVLTETRTLLLPKLISGEIDVSGLEIDSSWLAA
jgi:type I restriction enzyme S subunit